MPLPPEFKFTQSNLQDYVECARRFELRYVQALEWPAIEAEPVKERERHMQQGADFHHLVHQHLIGVPAEKLEALAADEPLRRWWAGYVRHGLTGLPEGPRYPEMALTAPLNGFRLLAKYDLIAAEPGGRIVIMDWKTAERRPARTRLAARLQTIVYPYLLVLAGAHLNGGTPVKPEQVEMVYWFAEDPANPERFPYSAEQYARDGEHLAALVDEIKARAQFDLTADEWRCKYCTYRSLCRRGVEAGDLSELDADFADAGDEAPDLDFDFDQIAEIAF